MLFPKRERSVFKGCASLEFCPVEKLERLADGHSETLTISFNKEYQCYAVAIGKHLYLMLAGFREECLLDAYFSLGASLLRDEMEGG